jgi:hypothetical protein
MSTHVELVDIAAKWLRRRHSVVITEMAGQPEEPDAIGFKGSHTTLIECKTSHSDFLADIRKPARQTWRRGMGDQRYYLCEPDVIPLDEVPKQWGLLTWNGKKVRTLKPADATIREKDWRSEMRLLLSCVRRIGALAPRGVSVKCYVYKTRNRASLGVGIPE